MLPLTAALDSSSLGDRIGKLVPAMACPRTLLAPSAAGVWSSSLRGRVEKGEPASEEEFYLRLVLLVGAPCAAGRGRIGTNCSTWGPPGA